MFCTNTYFQLNLFCFPVFGSRIASRFNQLQFNLCYFGVIRFFFYYFLYLPMLSFLLFSIFFFFSSFSFSNRPSRRQNSQKKSVEKFLLQKRTIFFRGKFEVKSGPCGGDFAFMFFLFSFFPFSFFFFEKVFSSFPFLCCIFLPKIIIAGISIWVKIVDVSSAVGAPKRCRVHDDIRRDSWEWVAPLAWEREHDLTHQSGGGSSSAC